MRAERQVLINHVERCSVSGGAEEDRTPDLLRARQALSQLSYGPVVLSERPEPLDAGSLS